jgi:hypothetical protein
MTTNNDDQLAVPTQADRNRLDAFWRAFSDVPMTLNVSPQNRMDAWVIEQRMIADRRANDRLARASGLLVWATVLLVIATVGLVIVTLVK